MTQAPPTASAARSDYHGHPNYFRVWLALVALLLGSLGFGLMGNHRLAVSLIFGVAVVKALMVAGNFMHLRWEPRMVWLVAGFGVLMVAFLYLGVMPDVLYVPQSLAK